jgi:hypothetical protein
LPHTLREEYGLQVFENRVQRTILGSQIKETMGEQKKISYRGASEVVFLATKLLG